MNQILSLRKVFCRPALERDLEEIREFCKGIWDGHDYVPDALEDWFREVDGVLAVAEYEGRAIGCAKLTRLAEGQWWLEGFRVDPKYQGLRVGSLIHHYVDRWWLEHGNGAIRLMTSVKNKSVHHLCASTGYTKLFEARGYKAEPLEGHAAPFTRVASSSKDLGNVVTFTMTSPSLVITNHLVDFGWRFVHFAPTENEARTLLSSLVSSLENSLFWWRNGQGLLIVRDDFDPEEDEYTMGIGVLACELVDISAFLLDVRHLAARQNKTSVFWLAPVHEQIELALQQAGYFTDWDNTAYIFEKNIPRTARHPSPEVFDKSFPQ